MIRLAINGAAGRMGALTCTLARDDSRFELVARISREHNAVADDRDAPIDVVIDFSTDQGTRDATTLAVQRGAALMVGTTGLSRQTLSAIELASQTIPVMIAPNTSAGIAVMIHLVSEAARLLGRDHDVNIVEVHHSGKRDAPSGTALRIAESIRERAGFELPADRIHAIRVGEVIGEHTVEFFSAGERIRVAHVATSRDLFARGALDAAAWLHGRSPGSWTIEQSLGLEISPGEGVVETGQ